MKTNTEKISEKLPLWICLALSKKEGIVYVCSLGEIKDEVLNSGTKAMEKIAFCYDSVTAINFMLPFKEYRWEFSYWLQENDIVGEEALQIIRRTTSEVASMFYNSDDIRGIE